MSGHYSIMDKFPLSKKVFAAELKGYMEKTKESWNFWRVPFGFDYSMNYGSMEVATYSLLHTQKGGDESYKDLAVDVLDFIFGVNAWGKSFVALKDIPSVKQLGSPIYLLQTHLFPEGGIPVGPLDGPTHDDQSKWIAFDPRSMEEHKFNTKEIKFLDHFDDYMCADVHTYGVADAIFFLSAISSVVGK